MEAARARSFDVALINPPFSLHLESPAMEAFECTTWGQFGPGTSAQSDEYAVAQALKAAQIVVAVVPASLAEEAVTRCAELFGNTGAARLRAVLRLPAGTFYAEGADVETRLLVFGADAGVFQGVLEIKDPATAEVPDLGLVLQNDAGRPTIRVTGMDDSGPAVTMAVTGNTRVRVCHSGRKIGLHFACGFVQARVMNAVYRDRVVSSKEHKLPRGVRYSGQGLLDVQNILVTDDPMGTFNRLLAHIRDAGGVPDVDRGLMGHLRKLIRQKPRNEAPFGHWVYMESHGSKVHARSVTAVALEPKSWTSPVIKAGDEAELSRTEDGWIASKGQVSRTFAFDEVQRLFEMPAVSDGWVRVHAPLQERFPEIAHDLEVRGRKLGLDKFLNWGYQFSDMVEVSMRPKGAVVAWLQGLGKARLAAALILLRNIRCGLVTMPAYLTGEFAKRLVSAGLDPSLWQIITSPEQLKSLRRINIISYERLRMPVRPARWVAAAMPVDNDQHVRSEAGDLDGEHAEPSKRVRIKDTLTYAKKLRHRVGMVCNDEGEILANWQSLQSRAIWQVAAPTSYVTTGTPIPSYPRDLLPIGAYAMGEGVVGQEYGLRKPLLMAANANSMEFAVRGIEAFAERHVITEWTTNEFAETLTEGAKREVPRINNVERYREWASRFVKRRVHREPEVEAWVKIPDPILKTITVDWDMPHLTYYLKTADEFAQWYRTTTPQERMSNFAVLLARIGAVDAAANIPQRQRKSGAAWTGGMTSKQREVVRVAVQEVDQGNKVVVFATSPRTLEILALGFEAQGIETCMYHGELDQAKRNRDLDRRFREGSASVLLATLGTMQSGFDLYQASRVILANRSWSSRTEEQAIRRLLRPQTEADVIAYRVHLKGGICIYQDQLVAFKKSAADAGLDWGAPMPADVPFQHLDTMLGRFVEELAALHGMKGHEYRKMIKEAA